MKRAIKVMYAGQAKEEFEQLGKIASEQEAKGESNSLEQQLLKSIRQKIEAIKANPMYGESVKKEQIPKNLDVSNLFMVKLSNYWRMLYSLEGNQIEIIAFVLFIIDHPTYDKLFGYGKK